MTLPDQFDDMTMGEFIRRFVRGDEIPEDPAVWPMIRQAQRTLHKLAIDNARAGRHDENMRYAAVWYATGCDMSTGAVRRAQEALTVRMCFATEIGLKGASEGDTAAVRADVKRICRIIRDHIKSGEPPYRLPAGEGDLIRHFIVINSR